MNETYAPRFPVLTVGISAINLATAVPIIGGWIERREPNYVNVCTTHTVLEAYDAPALAALINAAGLATPDGMPLVWLGRRWSRAVSRVYGPDLLLALCAHGLARGYRHYFYGGAPGVAEALAGRLEQRFAGLRIAGCYAPPFRALLPEEQRQDATRINASGADVVWVGLGTPRQDYWVAHMRAQLEAPALIPVGAAFDFHSGRIRQAPRWMQRSGLEWLFRLSQDPRRLWKRYLLGNPRFVWLVLRRLAQQRFR